MNERRENIFWDAEIILNEVYFDFFSQEKDPESGEPYTIYHACEYVIKKNNIDPVKILPELIRFSSLSPRDILETITPVPRATTWEDFATEMSYAILRLELRHGFPNVAKEDDKRLNGLSQLT